MQLLVTTFAAVLGWLLFRTRRRRPRLAHSVIVTPAGSTVFEANGGVRSVQSALLTLPESDLVRLWEPVNLENLGRTYWLFLTRATLGLIRVVYTENERRVVLLSPRLTLLRFDAPDYTLEPRHGNIRWRIKDGLLVARSGRSRGWLSVDVRRIDAGTAPESPLQPGAGPAGPAPGDPASLRMAELRIDVEVANFYPAIASSLGRFVYEGTQAFVHVLVTHAFLRSLGRLELKQSRVGRLQVNADGDLETVPN